MAATVVAAVPAAWAISASADPGDGQQGQNGQQGEPGGGPSEGEHQEQPPVHNVEEARRRWNPQNDPNMKIDDNGDGTYRVTQSFRGPNR